MARRQHMSVCYSSSDLSVLRSSVELQFVTCGRVAVLQYRTEKCKAVITQNENPNFELHKISIFRKIPKKVKNTYELVVLLTFWV